MTVHSYHPDSHTAGLANDCPRCQEHAAHPERGLDSTNLARLRAGHTYTALDRAAAQNLAAWDRSREDFE